MDIYQIIFSNNNEMAKIKAIIDEIAKTDIMVLVRGEAGSGRELLAKAIHLNSNRKEKPFVKIDCPLIPARYLSDNFFDLQESDTGGYFRMLGNVNSPDSGTILLRDLDQLKTSLQAKLLQALNDDASSHFNLPTEGEVQSIAPRVLATAENRLGRSGEEGYLSVDPFSKIHFITITVPPLRDRKEQIVSLSEYFLNSYKEKYAKDIPPFSSRTLDAFVKYDWPGNVVELENMVKRIVMNGKKDSVQQDISLGGLHGEAALGFYKNSSNHSPREKNSFTLRDVRKKAAEVAEVEIIRGILEKTHWNRKRAAKLLGISYHSLLYKIDKYDLMMAKG